MRLWTPSEQSVCCPPTAGGGVPRAQRTGLLKRPSSEEAAGVTPCLLPRHLPAPLETRRSPVGIKFSPSPGAVMPLSTGPGAEFLIRNRNVGLAPLLTAASHTRRWLEGGGLSKGWKPESTVSLGLGTSGPRRC